MANDEGIPSRLLGDRDADLLAQAKNVFRWGTRWEVPPRDYPVVRSATVYPPKHAGDRWLVVLKGYDEEGEIVAFHKGTSLLRALSAAFRRLLDGKADWKRETPWKDRR